MKKTEELFKAIERISGLVRAVERRQCLVLGLQPIHVRILEFLAESNQRSDTSVSVADYFGLTKGTVSQSLQVLERKELIYREVDAEDRRVMHLRLTAAGQTMLASLHPLHEFCDAEQHMNASQISQLEALLVVLLKTLQATNKVKSFGICLSCGYFQETEGHYVCGLTDEPLAQQEIEKICRDHITSRNAPS
ncbi:MAG: MarR family winged helix-turn-helix transcriptional regulator [Methylococcales bacterium]|nr:MarR family winged helix-turn-helix transcriptional regulator [Methylococcales bacterium]